MGAKPQQTPSQSPLYRDLRLLDINKPINSEKRKQVEQEDEAQCSRQQPSVTPPSFSILQLITLIRSLAGPPPARLSLTDGLFYWQ